MSELRSHAAPIRLSAKPREPARNGVPDSLDVAHAVFGRLAQFGALRDIGDRRVDAAEFVDQPAFLGLRTAPDAAARDFVDLLDALLARMRRPCR